MANWREKLVDKFLTVSGHKLMVSTYQGQRLLTDVSYQIQLLIPTKLQRRVRFNLGKWGESHTKAIGIVNS